MELWLVQVNLVRLNQCHQTRSGDRFGDRGEAIDGFRFCPNPVLDIGESESPRVVNLVVDDDGDGESWDSLFFHGRLNFFLHIGDIFLGQDRCGKREEGEERQKP